MPTASRCVRLLSDSVRLLSPHLPGLRLPGGRLSARWLPSLWLRLPALLVALTLAAPLQGAGQQDVDRSHEGPMPRVGGSLLYAAPQGEFAAHVAEGVGAGVFARLPMDRGGLASVRIDAGFINYGRERFRDCLTTCRLQVDVTTSNDIVYAGVGPEIGTPPGPLRLYGFATAGLAYFTTTSSISGSGSLDDFASTENFGDAVFAWRGGGGVQFRVWEGWRPIDLDLSTTYHGNGPATYLVEGGIRDHPDGSVTVFPRRSETDLVTVQLGVAVGLGGGSDPAPRDRTRTGK